MDCDPASKMKVVTAGVLNILRKLESEVSRRDDVGTWREFVLNHQSSFVGLGDSSLNSIEILQDGFVWRANSEFHARLLLDGEGIVEGAVERLLGSSL